MDDRDDEELQWLDAYGDDEGYIEYFNLRALLQSGPTPVASDGAGSVQSGEARDTRPAPEPSR